MNTIDEMTEVQKAWELFKKLEELKNLLLECYYKEFESSCLDKKESTDKINEATLPF